MLQFASQCVTGRGSTLFPRSVQTLCARGGGWRKLSSEGESVERSTVSDGISSPLSLVTAACRKVSWQQVCGAAATHARALVWVRTWEREELGRRRATCGACGMSGVQRTLTVRLQAALRRTLDLCTACSQRRRRSHGRNIPRHAAVQQRHEYARAGAASEVGVVPG